MSYNKLHVSFVKLRDICDISSGQNAPQNSEDYCPQGFTFIKASDLESVINDDNENNTTKITKSAITKYKLKQFPEQSVVFAKSGLSCKKNRIYVTKKTTFVVNHLCVLSNFSSDFLPNWIALFLKEFNVTRLIKDDSYPSIKLSDIGNIDIPVIDKAEQGEKVSEIESICSTIRNKKKQILNFDSLVKSRFIEMFGDKGFSEKPLAEYCFGNGAYGAQSASAPFQEGRPRYVRITDINDDGSLNDDVVCSINESDDMDYKLEYGDFLFARMGATVGKTYAFITGSQIYAGYCIRFKLDTSKINPRYLFWLTKQENYWRWVKENQSGAAQPGINAKKYGSLPVPNAPIDLQNQFASFVELIDKSRFVVQKEIKDLQELLDSKMDEYFGGEE